MADDLRSALGWLTAALLVAGCSADGKSAANGGQGGAAGQGGTSAGTGPATGGTGAGGSAGDAGVGGGAGTACDMTGTFAMRVEASVSWSNISYVENGTNVINHSWAIWRQTSDGNGHVSVSTSGCGGTTPEICGTGNPLLPKEAYALYLSNQIWDLPSLLPTTLEFDAPNAVPGAPFQTPQVATMLGLRLADPYGAWPANRNQIGAGANQVNGAVWSDDDQDGVPGVTTYAVPPGGARADGTLPDPPEDYPNVSPVCPRGGGAASPYNYTPAAEGLTVRRVQKIYGGTRSISALSGTITSCDRFEGPVTGPKAGQMQGDARAQGCVDDAPGGACSGTVADFFDGQAQTQQLNSARFVIVRVASEANAPLSCAQVRAMAFP